MEKSTAGEGLKGALEVLWDLLAPLVLPHYNEKHAVLTVLISLVCVIATLSWAFWGKLFVFGGYKVNKVVSKLGVIVSLPLVATLAVFLLYQILGFIWGLIPAPFGWQWVKDVAFWLIMVLVPAGIFFGVVWQIIRHPIQTGKQALGLLQKVKEYFKAGWGNAELAPLFVILGALGINYVVHHEKWSNSETYYAPSITMCLLGLVAAIQRSVRTQTFLKEKGSDFLTSPARRNKKQGAASEPKASPPPPVPPAPPPPPPPPPPLEAQDIQLDLDNPIELGSDKFRWMQCESCRGEIDSTKGYKVCPTCACPLRPGVKVSPQAKAASAPSRATGTTRPRDRRGSRAGRTGRNSF